MENRLSLVLRDDLGELERMAGAVSAWCKGNGVSATVEFHLNLALDEIVSNVMRHGWKDHGQHQLQVRMSLVADEVQVEVEDDAMAFNPLEVPAPDLNRSLDERPIGGLGIYLVRKVMDGIEYRRLDGRNLLVMKKKAGAT